MPTKDAKLQNLAGSWVRCRGHMEESVSLDFALDFSMNRKLLWLKKIIN